MNTKTFEQFYFLDDVQLSDVEGGGCNWNGAVVTVAAGAIGGAIKGAITTYTWQGAALKAVGYGIKSGITYGATCHWT